MGLSMEAMQRMRDAIGDDDLVLADILQSFVDEVDGLLATLESAACEGNVKSMRQSAHTLKSSCRDLGAEDLADLCARMEGEARNDIIGEAEQKSAKISAGCLALKAEVIVFVRKLYEGTGP